MLWRWRDFPVHEREKRPSANGMDERKKGCCSTQGNPEYSPERVAILARDMTTG